MKSDEHWMGVALSYARQAERAGEVPVGCVIVCDNELVSFGFNSPISENDPTSHAEIVALRKAGDVIQNYRLNGLTLYVTLEPCVMCLGAMLHARIDRLVFGAHDSRVGTTSLFSTGEICERFNHELQLSGGVLQAECSDILRTFFRQKR